MEVEQKQKAAITDHAFEPSTCYPEGQGCAHIVRGAEWTMFDPIRCRRPENEHAATERSNVQADRREPQSGEASSPKGDGRAAG